MVADGDDGGISLIAEFVDDDDSTSDESMPELLHDYDSSSDKESWILEQKI